MFLSLPVEVDCSDGAAVGITLKSNPPSAACTKKKYQKTLVEKMLLKARTHYDISYLRFIVRTLQKFLN